VKSFHHGATANLARSLSASRPALLCLSISYCDPNCWDTCTERDGFDSAKTHRCSPFESLSGSQPVEQTLRTLMCDGEGSRLKISRKLSPITLMTRSSCLQIGGATTKQRFGMSWKDILASPGLVVAWKATRVELGKSATWRGLADVRTDHRGYRLQADQRPGKSSSLEKTS